MSILETHHEQRHPECPNLAGDATATPFPVAWSRPVPGEEFTTRQHVYHDSRELVEAGVSVIPIDGLYGTKSPHATLLPRQYLKDRWKAFWKLYQLRRPHPWELLDWLHHEIPYGLGVVGGLVSGRESGCGLEVIDFDNAALAEEWMKVIGEQAPGVLRDLVRVITPRPGMHVYYRCPDFQGAQQLARGYEVDSFGQRALTPLGRPIPKTLIETKGEGGYCLIPPSPPRCHLSCRLYRYAEGSPRLTDVPIITPEERHILLDAARALNQWKEERPVARPVTSTKRPLKGDRPGDIFNIRANWPDILEPHGWTPLSSFGEAQSWCRPGKSSGLSATTNYKGSDLLYVFSTNADPLEHDRAYTKFSAFAVLSHDGDFTEATNAVRKSKYRGKF